MMKLRLLTLAALPLLMLAACAGDIGEQASSSAAGGAPAVDQAASRPAASGRAAAGAPASSTARAPAYGGFDIAGLYLGMSPEEATAAIKAYDPSIAIKQDAINFTYNALGKRHRTESFVHYMGGTVPGGSVSLEVRFSYPPEPLKVVAISRGHRQQVEPLSQAMYVESLIEKYGPPARDSGSVTAGQRVERTLEWPFGNGTVQCLPDGAEVQSTPPILDRIQRRLPNPTPQSVDSCISMLRYVLRGDPVTQASGGMFDVPAAAKAEFANQTWIQSLIDEKSKTGTERPRL